VSFAVLQLSEEVNQKLKVAAPLIIFFGMSKKEQIMVLPVLEERKYGFPDGDLVTSNTLEILLNGYQANLNSISIRLMSMQDESSDENIKDLADLVEQLLELINRILEEDFEVIDNANNLEDFEWVSLCQLSLAIQRKLEIEMTVNKKMIENCVEYWLHP
jgi:hypothetical protein